MKIRGSDRNLESFRIFPIAAWSCVIGFAVFVYTLTMNLQSTTTELESQANFLETTSKKPLNEHTDFESEKPLN
ncbi:MAG: hypothetical protein RL538_339 [Candidatus Parcubacteria bacterium]|jgi:Tfp pilus assembly protein PilN